MNLSSHAKSMTKKSLVVTAACLAATIVAASTSRAAGSPRDPAPRKHTGAITARLFAKVAGHDPGLFGTSLEGAAFDASGHFYFVNTTAPANKPKLMRLDLATRHVTSLYTDKHTMLNCIGFGPKGVMYPCDLRNGRHGGGRVVRYDPATRHLVTVLNEAGSSAVVPDDMTVDSSGNLYIADYQGTPTDPTGRIVLRQADGTASVLLAGLAHPNGITFTGDQTGLWIDRDLSGTLDHVAEQPSSPAAAKPTVTLHTAAYLSLGANAYTDSLTVDGQGNVYLAVYGESEVLIFNPNGRQIGRVTLPASVPHVTHVAIKPGTRRAFVTASGRKGGFIYTFQALAAAPTGQPNGG